MKREMVHKLAMAVAAAFVGLLLLADAQAQTPISRDAVVLSSGDTGRFDNTIGSGLTKFEYNVTGTPATASIVLKGCMRGGTCDTLQTDTNTTDTMRLISGLWDYMTIVPTFTGGTAPKVSVKMTSITRSPMGQSFGVVASTSGGASNVNLAQVGGTNTVTGGVAGSQGVGGLAAPGAAQTGNPVQVAWGAAGSNAFAIPSCVVITATVCEMAMGQGVTGADSQVNQATWPVTGGGSQSPWGVYGYVYHDVNNTWDRLRGIHAAFDNAGIGITAVGDVAQLDETSTATCTENQFCPQRIDSRRLLYVRTTAPTPINCVVPVSTATTIQAVAAGCAAPGAGLSIYITDIEFGSSAASGVAADSFPTLKSGTGGTCGTATAVIWQALTAANTTQVVNLSQPIKVAVNSEVCWIMTTAGSKTIAVHGFIAP